MTVTGPARPAYQALARRFAARNASMRSLTAFAAALVLASGAHVPFASADTSHEYRVPPDGPPGNPRPVAPNWAVPIPHPESVTLYPQGVSWIPFGLSLGVGAAGMGVGIWAAVTANSSSNAKGTIIAPAAFAVGS